MSTDAIKVLKLVYVFELKKKLIVLENSKNKINLKQSQRASLNNKIKKYDYLSECCRAIKEAFITVQELDIYKNLEKQSKIDVDRICLADVCCAKIGYTFCELGSQLDGLAKEIRRLTQKRDSEARRKSREAEGCINVESKKVKEINNNLVAAFDIPAFNYSSTGKKKG